MMNHKRFQAWLSQVDQRSAGPAPISMQELRKNCGKTFNAATGAPPAGLRRQEKQPAFGICPADGETARASAARCGLAVNTAFRRRRFLAARSRDPGKPAGIVEANETYALESRKGERNLDRKARRRGGTTVSAVFQAVNADALRSAQPVRRRAAPERLSHPDGQQPA